MFIKGGFYISNRGGTDKLRLSVLALHDVVYEVFILTFG